MFDTFECTVFTAVSLVLYRVYSLQILLEYYSFVLVGSVLSAILIHPSCLIYSPSSPSKIGCCFCLCSISSLFVFSHSHIHVCI